MWRGGCALSVAAVLAVAGDCAQEGLCILPIDSTPSTDTVVAHCCCAERALVAGWLGGVNVVVLSHFNSA